MNIHMFYPCDIGREERTNTPPIHQSPNNVQQSKKTYCACLCYCTYCCISFSASQGREGTVVEVSLTKTVWLQHALISHVFSFVPIKTYSTNLILYSFLFLIQARNKRSNMADQKVGKSGERSVLPPEKVLEIQEEMDRHAVGK